MAREHRLSAQAIRNYEAAGILPPAVRSAAGYRRYTPVHAQALRTFLALRSGHGYVLAAEIMRATNRGDTEAAFGIIDAGHVELLAQRQTRTETARALDSAARAIGNYGISEELAGVPLTVGELARRLGVHPATLRTWEVEGILHPQRDPATGYRQFGPNCVRDAEIARQLRRGGYQLRHIPQFIDSLREAGGPDALRAFLDSWQRRLSTRSRHLLQGAAQLDAYLTMIDQT